MTANPAIYRHFSPFPTSQRFAELVTAAAEAPGLTSGKARRILARELYARLRVVVPGSLRISGELGEFPPGNRLAGDLAELRSPATRVQARRAAAWYFHESRGVELSGRPRSSSTWGGGWPTDEGITVAEYDAELAALELEADAVLAEAEAAMGSPAWSAALDAWDAWMDGEKAGAPIPLPDL